MLKQVQYDVEKNMFITGFHSIEEKVRSQKKNQAAAGAGKAEGFAAGSAYKIYFSKPGPRVKKDSCCC